MTAIVVNVPLALVAVVVVVLFVLAARDFWIADRVAKRALREAEERRRWGG